MYIGCDPLGTSPFYDVSYVTQTVLICLLGLIVTVVF